MASLPKQLKPMTTIAADTGDIDAIAKGKLGEVVRGFAVGQFKLKKVLAEKL